MQNFFPFIQQVTVVSSTTRSGQSVQNSDCPQKVLRKSYFSYSSYCSNLLLLLLFVLVSTFDMFFFFSYFFSFFSSFFYLSFISFFSYFSYFLLFYLVWSGHTQLCMLGQEDFPLKWLQFPDLVCSVHVITITIVVSYYNNNFL